MSGIPHRYITTIARCHGNCSFYRKVNCLFPDYYTHLIDPGELTPLHCGCQVATTKANVQLNTTPNLCNATICKSREMVNDLNFSSKRLA